MQEVAKEHGMVIIVPIYEEEIAGIYYNTAAVSTPMASIWANTARITFPTSIPASGKVLFPSRESGLPDISNGLCTDWSPTSVMTGTFPKAPGLWA